MAAVKNNVFFLTFTAVLSALIASLMLFSRLIGVADYSCTLLCGLLIGVVVIECGPVWASGAYVVSSLLGLFLSGNECSLLFLVFFGYYPIVKPLIDRLPKAVRILLKLLAFNAVIVLSYALIDAFVLPDLLVLKSGSVWAILVLLLVANAVFCLYDILFARMMSLYMAKLHPTVAKMKKGR